jgi:hypothetical protein
MTLDGAWPTPSGLILHERNVRDPRRQHQLQRDEAVAHAKLAVLECEKWTSEACLERGEGLPKSANRFEIPLGNGARTLRKNGA